MEDKPDIKILLIEDEEDVLESYVDMFSFLGYSVDTAHDGKDGLEKAQRTPFDIVITDLNMPVMNGLEVLRRLKKRNSETEVIVITGFATIENAIDAMKQGAFDYITKPISIEHVKIVLSKCIQQINARRENKELRDSNTELRKLNELKDKFITITNHELRTPLAVIKGYFDLLSMDLEEIGNDETKEFMQIIETTLSEMIDMIENMHDLSSIEKLIKNQDQKIFIADDVVNDIYRETKILFEKRQIDFVLNLNGSRTPVCADRKQLKKALCELIQNALKFTDSGGSVGITVKNILPKNQVYIVIKDSGVGIPHDKIDLIFEPFYEVQDVMHHFTSKTDFMGGGIGVGLCLAKGIIESNGGEIAVESMPGKGSSFTIILPAADSVPEINNVSVNV